MIAWANNPAVDWTQVNLDNHRAAWEKAKADFVEHNEGKPITFAD